MPTIGNASKRTLSNFSHPSRTFFRQSFELQPLRNGATRRFSHKVYFPPEVPDTEPSVLRALWLLIGLNTVVFGGWQYAEYKRDSGLLRTLQDNFLLSWNNVRNGRPWVTLTSAFSHMGFQHFTFNMFSLYTFGYVLTHMPGLKASRILTLCLGSGLAGSAAWLYERQAPARTNSVWDRAVARFREGNSALLGQATALGASGMVMGVGAAATLFAPLYPVRLYFLPRIPLFVSTIGFLAVDTYFLGSDRTGIGHSAHLGGAVFGAAFYLLSLRRIAGGLFVGPRRWFM
ncbi:hypothetical protein LTR17_016734 [Elasticomyces elasticus]|nr:hypothetical protein LTR17_016734 [Elasticomyces elasticus]